MKKVNQYQTAGGVSITRHTKKIAPETSLQNVLGAIDCHRGAIFASGYEYPGRYTRWDVGFVNPPIEFVAHGRQFYIRALNERGKVLLHIFHVALENHPHIVGKVDYSGGKLSGQVAPMSEDFQEEERLRQPTIFSVLRTLARFLGYDKEPNLGFYGAFGYDLVFQIEPIALRHPASKIVLICTCFFQTN
mgnify:FL=1